MYAAATKNDFATVEKSNEPKVLKYARKIAHEKKNTQVTQYFTERIARSERPVLFWIDDNKKKSFLMGTLITAGIFIGGWYGGKLWRIKNCLAGDDCWLQ